jgi:hypothetical protein
MDANPTPDRELLPQSFAHPLAMLAMAILPQAALAWLNLADLQRLAETLNPGQMRELTILAVSQLGLLLAGLTLALTFLRRRRDIPLAWMPAWLAATVGYAVMGSIMGGQIVDANTGFWLAGAEGLGLRQAMLVLPGAFLAGLRLACAPLRILGGRDFGTSLAVMVGIPVGWYVLFTMLTSTWRWMPSATAIVLLLTLLTLLSVLAAMRVMALAARTARNWKPLTGTLFRFIWRLAIGLLGPLGGLCLNAEIPFPFDFQAPILYTLAALNGLLLIMPEPRRPLARHALWFARAALFPYAMYFFVVFLPFTAFFLPALPFFAAGLLILVPTGLFLTQGAILWDGLGERVAALGRGRTAVGLCLALALLPAGFLAQAAWHRTVLHQALDYVYPAEGTVPTSFPGNRLALRGVLDNLARSKAESPIPFLSGWYDAQVFDGLMLPDAKLKDLYRVFFAAEPPELPADQRGLFFMRGGARRNWDSWGMGSPPPATAQLARVDWQETPDKGFRRIQADVHLRNPDDAQVEFATTIRLPPGALITGFWLYIGEDKVPGVIFERKTALWVYRTIRDRTRRDPGILVYHDDGTVEFRVFPLEARQDRRAVIEFGVPDAVAGEVAIGGEVHTLAPVRRNGIQVIRREGLGIRVVAGPEVPLPRLRRRPSVSIVADTSRPDAWEGWLRQAVGAARAIDGVEQVHVLLATPQGVRHLERLAATEDAVLAAARTAVVPPQAGFFRDRLVRLALLAHLGPGPEGDHPGSGQALSRPLVLLATSGEDGVAAEEHPARLLHLIPDAAVLSPGEVPPEAPEVILLRAAGLTLAAAPGDGGWQQCFPHVPHDAAVEVYDPAVDAFTPLPETSLLPPPGGVMAEATDLWLDQACADTGLCPPNMSLAERVAASRGHGVMLTATSYIVVEQDLHWQALKELEAARLAGHQAFEPVDTPEPPAWTLLLTLAAWLAWRRLRRDRPRRHDMSSVICHRGSGQPGQVP